MARHRELLLDHSNHRRLPADYNDDVLLWDIDKTYLDTHFSSLRGLAAIPFEFAVDKHSIAGSVPLLRALRRGPGKVSAIVPLFFISGSPPQLRRVIEKRMTFDGVDFDGITFKDQLGLLWRGRPRGLTEQVGYKLTALLLYRSAVPAAARWWMFGDDVEKDAEVFSLFGEVCAGLRGSDLELRLLRTGVHRQDIHNVLERASRLEVGDDPVAKIFIHLARQSDPAQFGGERVVATRSYLQTALVLHQAHKISDAAVSAVARELRLRGMPETEITSHLDDAHARLAIPRASLELAK